MSKEMTIHLKYWKQNGPNDRGHFEEYTLDSVNEHMSFLEMLDVLNEELPKSDDNGKFFLSIFPDAAQIPNIAGLIELYSQEDREDEF